MNQRYKEIARYLQENNIPVLVKIVSYYYNVEDGFCNVDFLIAKDGNWDEIPFSSTYFEYDTGKNPTINKMELFIKNEIESHFD